METVPLHGRRLFACLLDWYLCSVLITAMQKLLTELSHASIRSLSIEIAIFAILITIVYVVLIPLWMNGQTIGKRIMKLRIVKLDHTLLTGKDLVLRELLGTFLIEGSIFAGSDYFRELLQILSNQQLLVGLSILSSIITIGSIGYMFFNQDRRMFHDLIARTKVVRIN